VDLEKDTGTDAVAFFLTTVNCVTTKPDVAKTKEPAKKRSGKVTISAYKLVVTGDANTVTGKINWDYDNGVCDGISKVTYERK
jgi:hypothetical protein